MKKASLIYSVFCVFSFVILLLQQKKKRKKKNYKKTENRGKGLEIVSFLFFNGIKTKINNLSATWCKQLLFLFCFRKDDDDAGN